MATSPQLLLLADHIKLSLLERQRAISLKIEPTAGQDSNISRSLESLREGIQRLEKTDPSDESISSIRSQYNDLSRQFHGESSTTAAHTLTSPNDPSLAADFSAAQSSSRLSNLKVLPFTEAAKPSPKSVRFRDNPSAESLPDAEHEATRAALFPSRYTDTPDDAPPDSTAEMSNQQIHQYHQQVLQEQDEQLDTLGESIGRQRHLSIQIGDELESQGELLDDVDRGVDRHQTRLDGAKRRLKGVGERAKANWGMTTIIVLIVILVLLIFILK
jgi:syntaxin 8